MFTTQSKVLMNLGWRAFETIVEKGENAGNQHFLLFPQDLLHYQFSRFNLSSANALNLNESRISSLGNELKSLNIISNVIEMVRLFGHRNKHEI